MSKRVLSALILVGLLSAVLAAPASAAQRALTKQICESSGGRFSSDRGVKHCTHVSTYTTQENLGNIGYLPATDPFVWEYKASYVVGTTWQRTVIESQIGNRDVLTTTPTDVQIGQAIIGRSCSRTLIDPIFGIVIEGEDLDRDPAECAALGLYPTL